MNKRVSRGKTEAEEKQKQLEEIFIVREREIRQKNKETTGCKQEVFVSGFVG